MTEMGVSNSCLFRYSSLYPSLSGNYAGIGHIGQPIPMTRSDSVLNKPGKHSERKKAFQ